MQKILAGDVGGTKTVLAIFSQDSGELIEHRKQTFPSGQHTEFVDLVQEFLQGEEGVSSAVFGIAGPINDQKCITTNLPWMIDASALREQLGIENVYLLNDLESAAYGILQLDAFFELNPNSTSKQGHKAVIAAGTGLGEAILFFDGTQYHAMPTEGGHTEFAPQNALEDSLLVFLRERFNGHVSLERILSGDGFGHLYDFLKSIDFAPANYELELTMQTQDRNAVISEAGMMGQDALCQEVVRLFCRIYGVEAGSFALKTLPAGGIYIAGGIAPKIRSALQNGEFMQGFLDKGRMTHAIENIPVRIVDNAEAPLLGAAHFAFQLIQKM
ncbi:glucokinase [Thiomicrorhabdus indica]|uniref:glucokinase n=1 Tax=Thiomicrorhabdus indica TaxID=2267253 RepID=UPI002AA7D5CA|nr:glucokinase [Thiomicrorhabdus indica]